MSTNMTISEHVSNPSPFRRWRIVNVGLLLIALFLPWITTSCDAHAPVPGYEALTQSYIFFDPPVIFLTLALPAYVLANVLMALGVPFQRRIWLTVPVTLTISTVAVGGYYLLILLNDHTANLPVFLMLLCWLLALPVYALAYTLLSHLIPPRRKPWLKAPFVLYIGVSVVSGCLLAASVAGPSNAATLTVVTIWCVLFIAANILMAFEVPVQRRSWLLIPLSLCVFGAVGGIWGGFTYRVDLELLFGAYVFLLGLVSAVVLELYEVRAARTESGKSKMKTGAVALAE